jgi:hypothetical protein
MSSASHPTNATTRRTFLGWWLGTLLTATVVTAVAPLAVYLFPPRNPNQVKEKIRVGLDKSQPALTPDMAGRTERQRHRGRRHLDQRLIRTL